MINDNVVSLQLSESLYKKIQNIVYDYFGIHLKENKKLMIRNRLSKRVKHLKLQSFKDYLDYLESKDDGREFQEFINAVTTNKTDFFREHKQFDYLSEIILPAIHEKKLKNNNKTPIRVWSAGCSTGAEPYTISMVCWEYFEKSQLDFRVLASDINSEVLDYGKTGVYKEEELAPVSKQRLRKFFLKGVGNNEGTYKVKSFLREKILFSQLNLFLPTFPIRKNIDIIFCRNVSIYFDQQKKIELFEKFYNMLSDGGYMFIGHSESLNNINKKFKFYKNNIYIK